jgi:hypothetical protein
MKQGFAFLYEICVSRWLELLFCVSAWALTRVTRRYECCGGTWLAATLKCLEKPKLYCVARLTSVRDAVQLIISIRLRPFVYTAFKGLRLCFFRILDDGRTALRSRLAQPYLVDTTL